jgi:hypothetical protein
LMEDLWAVSDSELQDLKTVFLALQEQEAMAPGGGLKTRQDEIKNQAIKLAHSLLGQRQSQYAELQDQANKLKSQLDAHPMAGVSDRQRELLRQQTDYQAQIDELEKLRTQIGVESRLTTTRLRVIQPAFADPSTRRPILVLKYSVCVLLALLVTILALIIIQYRTSGARARFTKKASGSKREMDYSLAGIPSQLNQAVSEMGG